MRRAAPGPKSGRSFHTEPGTPRRQYAEPKQTGALDEETHFVFSVGMLSLRNFSRSASFCGLSARRANAHPSSDSPFCNQLINPRVLIGGNDRFQTLASRRLNRGSACQRSKRTPLALSCCWISSALVLCQRSFAGRLRKIWLMRSCWGSAPAEYRRNAEPADDGWPWSRSPRTSCRVRKPASSAAIQLPGWISDKTGWRQEAVPVVQQYCGRTVLHAVCYRVSTIAVEQMSNITFICCRSQITISAIATEPREYTYKSIPCDFAFSSAGKRPDRDGR